MKNPAIAFILILCLSCTSKETKSNKAAGKYMTEIKGTAENLKIEVNKDILKTKTKLSDFCDSLWYVILDSKKESMFGEMSKIIVNDKYILIADYSISKAVFIFDLNGKFINKISKLGKGPFEYMRIADVCYWAQTNTIFIFDGDNRKIIEYDITGKPLREIALTFWARNMAILDYNNFVFYAGFRENEHLKYNLIYVNNKGEIIKKGFPIDSRLPTEYAKNNPFNYLGNQLCFAPDYDRNSYNVDQDAVSYRYKIDFLRKNIPDDFYYNKTSDENDIEISKNKYAYVNEQFESENYFFANVIDESTNILQFIYSKKEKEGCLFYSTINDIPNSFINPFFIGNVGDVFYSKVETELLLMIKNDLIAKKNTLPKKNKLIDMFLNYNETDNPILAFYRIKFPKNTK